MNEQNRNMIPAVLIGGVCLGVTSALPVIEWLNCACCVLVIGGGVLASFIYTRDHPVGSGPITYGDGLLLGLLTGLLGGLVWTAVEVPLAYFQLKFGAGIDDLAELEKLISDPEIPPFVQELLTLILTGGALSLGILLIALVAHLVVAVIFASIGGVIGIALFQPKTPDSFRHGSPPSVPQAPTAFPGSFGQEEDDDRNPR